MSRLTVVETIGVFRPVETELSLLQICYPVRLVCCSLTGTPVPPLARATAHGQTGGLALTGQRTGQPSNLHHPLASLQAADHSATFVGLRLSQVLKNDPLESHKGQRHKEVVVYRRGRWMWKIDMEKQVTHSNLYNIQVYIRSLDPIQVVIADIRFIN